MSSHHEEEHGEGCDCARMNAVRKDIEETMKGLRGLDEKLAEKLAERGD